MDIYTTINKYYSSSWILFIPCTGLAIIYIHKHVQLNCIILYVIHKHKTLLQISALREMSIQRNIYLTCRTLKIYKGSYKYNNIDTAASMKLTYSSSKFNDMTLYTMCVVTCTKTSNIASNNVYSYMYEYINI